MVTLRGLKKKIQMQTHANIRYVNFRRNEKENTDADTS